ncbi:MAG: US12 family protein [Thermoguttaceae bacterium]|nr:US12 family protein [Thermoguttaceae bacterium]
MESKDIFEAYESPYARQREAVRAEDRSTLVTKTYLNLSGAVFAFAVLEALIFMIVGPAPILELISTNVRVAGIVMLGICMGGPWLGTKLLGENPSRGRQYGLLCYYVAMYAIIMTPLLALALAALGLQVIVQAACITAALFVALSSVVFMTRANFSGMRSFLWFASVAALILIVASFIFPSLVLGIWFSGAMVVLAGAYILYDTSKLMREARVGDDVLCAVEIFASLMMLFYYVLRILMALNRR